MRMVVGSCSEYVCKWVAAQLGQPNALSGQEYGLAIVYRDEIIAGVVYHDWTKQNCFMSIASISPYWASKSTLRQIFGYPFNQMQVNRVSVIVAEGTDERVKWRKTLINRFGFVHEGRLEDWFGEGQHAHFLRMKRQECRWIDVREGQQLKRAAV